VDYRRIAVTAKREGDEPSGPRDGASPAAMNGALARHRGAN
jgi:hypothetical protein